MRTTCIRRHEDKYEQYMHQYVCWEWLLLCMCVCVYNGYLPNARDNDEQQQQKSTQYIQFNLYMHYSYVQQNQRAVHAYYEIRPFASGKKIHWFTGIVPARSSEILCFPHSEQLNRGLTVGKCIMCLLCEMHLHCMAVWNRPFGAHCFSFLRSLNKSIALHFASMKIVHHTVMYTWLHKAQCPQSLSL